MLIDLTIGKSFRKNIGYLPVEVGALGFIEFALVSSPKVRFPVVFVDGMFS
jgi:hypothetical protein